MKVKVRNKFFQSLLRSKGNREESGNPKSAQRPETQSSNNNLLIIESARTGKVLFSVDG